MRAAPKTKKPPKQFPRKSVAQPPAQRWWASRSIQVAALGAVLCALVLISYANSLSNGFVWDDNTQLVMNPDIRSGTPWMRLFSSDVWGFEHPGQPARTNYYRPLQMVTYRIASGWFGFDARSFHLLSILFALAAVLVAFWVFLKLTGRTAIAFAAAALFAVHPVHSEAVDWIAALPELGCGILVLLAVGFFLSLRQRTARANAPSGPARPLAFWGLSLLAFAAALLWKETAAVLPLLVAAYVVCFEPGGVGQRIRAAARLSLPYWCVLAAYLIVRLRMLGFLSMRQRIWDLTPVQVGLSALHLMMRYWGKLIVPVQLNAYHEFTPVRSLADVRALLAIGFALLVCVLVWYGFRRRPLLVFAALWVFITLLPVMDIYALGRNVLAERYLYLPSAGFCLLVALIAASAATRLPARARKPVGALLLVVALAASVAVTLDRNPDWKDDATLFRQTLQLSPNAAFVHFMVASTESNDEAGAQSAEAHYLKTIELAQNETPPDLLHVAKAYEGLASLYSDHGNYDRALELLGRVRRLYPDDPDVDGEQGLILVHAGRWQQAEPLLHNAVARNPRNENAINALGLLAWQNKRDLPEAAALFTQALDIHTSHDDFRASLHNNLGGVYGDLRQFPQAMEQFKSAVAISPSDPEYRTNLASALAAMGRYEEATAEATSALRIAPNYPPARAVLEQLGSVRPLH